MAIPKDHDGMASSDGVSLEVGVAHAARVERFAERRLSRTSTPPPASEPPSLPAMFVSLRSFGSA